MNELKTPLIRTIGGKRIVHIVTCPYIREWDIDGCEPLTGKPKWNKLSVCQTCGKSVYITNGATDFSKKQKEYERLFEEVSLSKVKTLYINQKAKTRIVGSRFYVMTKHDSWYIDFTLGKIRLFHGNYDIYAREANEEFFKESGYHEHNCGSTFNSAISQIIRYDYKQAEKRHKSQRKKQRRQRFADLVHEEYADYLKEYDEYELYSEY